MRIFKLIQGLNFPSTTGPLIENLSAQAASARANLTVAFSVIMNAHKIACSLNRVSHPDGGNAAQRIFKLIKADK